MSCVPLLKQTNRCGIYSASLAIYGKNLAHGAVYDARALVKASVTNSIVEASRFGVIRTSMLDSSVQSGEGITFHDGETPSNDISPGAKAGLIVSTLALVCGLVLIVLYFGGDDHEEIKRRTSEEQRGFLKKHQSSNSTYLEETDSYSDSHASSQTVQQGLQIRGTSRVILEFDNDENVFRPESVPEDEASLPFQGNSEYRFVD